jgi:heme exporter protein D
MKGYGLYVWSAFSFTLISFATLYTLIKINLLKEQNKFSTKFGLLDKEKIKVAQIQSTNREILASKISSKI